MDDVRVFKIDMPMSVKGYTVKKDDFYTIIINSNLNEAAQTETYNHELDHIKNGDFDYGVTETDQIELQAHGLPVPDPEPAAPVVKRKKRKRRKNNRWKKRRELLGILGMNTLDIHEQHWLDPDYKF